MTVRVTGPDGARWTIRRSVVRGRGGRGWRWRWRGPRKLRDVVDHIDFLDFGGGDDLVGCLVGIAAVPLLVLAAIFLPFLALGLLEALVLAVVVLLLAAAATLLGRPILIRAEREPDLMRVWAAKGWRESRRVRDRIVGALRDGTDPDTAAGAQPVVSHGA